MNDHNRMKLKCNFLERFPGFGRFCCLEANIYYASAYGELICRCKSHLDHIPVWIILKEELDTPDDDKLPSPYCFIKLTKEEVVCLGVMTS
jgi:hypothetical protein